MRKRSDCVEAKHCAQERIVAETAGMSEEEESAYWRRQEEAWREECKQRSRKSKPAPTQAP